MGLPLDTLFLEGVSSLSPGLLTSESKVLCLWSPRPQRVVFLSSPIFHTS